MTILELQKSLVEALSANEALLQGGCIGLRQLAPMIGEYANLRVYSLK